MKLNVLFFSFLLLTASYSYGQLGLNGSEGAKALAMGGAGGALDGSYAMFNNQAGILSVDDLEVVLDVQRRFSLADLSVVSAGVVKNWKYGSFGLMLSSYGQSAYSDQKIGLAYAKKLTDILDIGGQLNVLQVRIDNFGSSTSVSFELGAIAELSSELKLGVHINNPVSIAITESTDIDSRFRLGLNYTPSSKVQLIAEADKILDDTALNFRLGIDYALGSALHLRAGYSTSPGTVSFGLGYRFRQSLQFDAAYSYHEQLGYTPGISIIWTKK